VGKLSAVFAALFLLAGCVSLAERTGRLLDGSARAERVLAVYSGNGLEVRVTRDRDGYYSLLVFPETFPSARIRTTFPDTSGTFLLVSLDYLGGNEHGWNEFSLDLFGSGSFVRSEPVAPFEAGTPAAFAGSGRGETGARFSVSAGFEPVQISRGRIRRFDTRITGGDALTYLRNRRERVLALVEWMHAEGATVPASPPDLRAGYAGRIYAENADVPEYLPRVPCAGEFDRRWRPVLFPEVARNRDRPQGWLLEGDVRVRAENVGWNTGYTERVFPEPLWNVRNSGTLLRDWEEALEWIHLKYHWDALAQTLSRETGLVRLR